MGITIKKSEAEKVLRAAYEAASEGDCFLDDWKFLATSLREADAPRTYTAALVTALLARACDESVDPLSIKEKYGERAFSLRTLCHGVVVPMSVDLGFDLGATGREPINNQPFFRYDHYSEIVRVTTKARPYLDRVSSALARVDEQNFSTEDSFHALVAVLAVCIDVANKKRRVAVGSAIVEASLIAETQRFVVSGHDVPRKLQACVAAGLDMAYDDVISRRINDPSRDLPGDVQVIVDGYPLLTVEVRGKSVSQEGLEQFVRSATDAGFRRVALMVDAASHVSLTSFGEPTSELEWKYECIVKVNESVSSFLRDVFVWSPLDTDSILSAFPEAMYRRMIEIEVRDSEMERWTQLFPEDA
ncbi:restriction endonuclease, SacI family [Streptomyces sp. FXJ1.172]|uniref:restriction endonuclease, SacI family n=1 Tax=Streptomyces sp. FXJ1.172 TaxID=710705 RepID=UPI0007CEFFC0|nr:restriction endonuclease, SacI family [Streptomyces sp. FXJ1.172]WEO95346.1 restriction endonuclease, SacI family [Streptomyces sp. FXJ1.172]